MTEERIATLHIQHCNTRCPYFYHNYYDNENVWCAKLNQKVTDWETGDLLIDYKERPFPEDCPLTKKEDSVYTPLKEWLMKEHVQDSNVLAVLGKIEELEGA